MSDIQGNDTHNAEEGKHNYSPLTRTVTTAVAGRLAYLAAQEAQEESELLYRAGKAINAARTFDEVVQAVAQLTDGSQAIFLTLWENFDYRGATYVEVAAAHSQNIPDLPIGVRFPPEAFPLVQRIPHEGLVVVEDVLNDPRIDPLSAATLALNNTRSVIGVAITMNNRWMGGITMHSSTPHIYNDRSQRLALGIGDLVTAAVERIRLQMETEAAMQRAELMAQFNAALSQATDEWQILSAVALYTEQIHPDFISLSYVQWDKQGNPNIVNQIAAWQNGQPAPESPLLKITFKLDELPAAKAFADAPERVLAVNNVATSHHLDQQLKDMLLGFKAQALIFVPLHSGARWQGLVTLSWKDQRTFTPNDLVVCEALIRSVGAVVTSRRAYLAEEKARQETELRVRELETVAKVSAAAASIMDVNELLRTVSDLTRVSFNLHRVHIYLLDEGANGLILSTGAQTRQTQQREKITLQSIQSPVARAGLKRRGTIVDGLTLPPDFFNQSDQVQVVEIRSRMAVPMIAGEKLIGVMEVQATEADRFTQADIRVMSTLADLTAVAVQNARSYQQAQVLAVLEERNRLARELHDSVSQALYGIALGIRTARTLLERDPQKAADPLNYTLSLAEAALAEMRSLIFELRPETLEKEGLVAALTKQATSLQTRHGIDVELNLCDEPKLPLEVKEAIYRITREALHNTVKHAKASRASLMLCQTQDGISFTVCDNGVGFDPNGSFPDHLGLKSMRERATRLDGTLSIESSPQNGTCVKVDIPWNG